MLQQRPPAYILLQFAHLALTHSMVSQCAGNGRCLVCNTLDLRLNLYYIVGYDRVLKGSEIGCDLCFFFKTVAEALWMSLV
jgi:hypothetical protein